MDLKIDINDLDHFDTENLTLDFSADDNTGMAIIEGFRGFATIKKSEILDIRKDFEEDNQCFVDKILLTGTRTVVYRENDVEIDVEVTLEEKFYNDGIIFDKINVDIANAE